MNEHEDGRKLSRQLNWVTFLLVVLTFAFGAFMARLLPIASETRPKDVEELVTNKLEVTPAQVLKKLTQVEEKVDVMKAELHSLRQQLIEDIER